MFNFLSKNKRKNQFVNSNPKVAIIYYIPKESSTKYNNWVDGFTKGIDCNADYFDITWINIEDSQPDAKELNKYDFLIAKCCWNSKVDLYLRSVKNLKTPRGIVISCSIVPKKKDIKFYQVLWYQTYWFGEQLPKHPCKIHTYGINSEDFKPQSLEKEIDVLSIGALTGYKRLEKLIDIPGTKKVVIGETNYADSDAVIKQLTKHGITIKSYVSQKELSNLINKSKLVYIPAGINGGGERAIMEAKSCNVPVGVEKDNPKLKEIVDAPSWDENYYGKQIKKGIDTILKIKDNKIKSSNLIESNAKLMSGNNSFHNGNLEVRGDESVTIGSYCSFGKNVSILTSNHDTNFIATQGYVYRKNFQINHPGETNIEKTKERTKGPVTIGNDVWIGDDVKILSGVSIGDGACIGAGTIVVKDVPSYEIHAGIPNKKIKLRFNKDVIDLLLSIKWWNWSEKRIKKNQSLFSLNLNKTDLETIKKAIKP